MLLFIIEHKSGSFFIVSLISGCILASCGIGLRRVNLPFFPSIVSVFEVTGFNFVATC